MRYLSAFSGIETATVAWQPLGWVPVAFAEVAKFPCAVLALHYPDVPNWGDVRNYKEWPHATVDVLIGGSPCQSFSVAGHRSGLADARGSLAFSYFAIAQRYTPRWLVFENVPGILSAHKGADFGTILTILAELGYGYAWRVLDAQFVRVDGLERAVPQRRRRVFVVGYLGDYRRAAAVLFERESLCGSAPPRRETWQDAAAAIAPSLVRSGRGVERIGDPRGQDPLIAFGGNNGSGSIEVATAVNAHASASRRLDFESETFIAVAETVTASWHRSNGAKAGRNSGLINPVIEPQAFDMRGRDQGSQLEGPHDTACMRAADGGSSRSYVAGHRIRRLLPLECERLQGLPDDYTLIPYHGRLAADGPRYRALGEAFAVNVVRWIGRRIEYVERLAMESAA